MTLFSLLGAFSALVYSPVDLIMIQQQKLTMSVLGAIKVRACARACVCVCENSVREWTQGCVLSFFRASI